MSWPALPAFGIVNNPLLDTPFCFNNDEGTDSPVEKDGFLLLVSTPFLLLDGNPLLLL